MLLFSEVGRREASDLLADPKDVELLISKLEAADRKIVLTKLVQGYSHLDFTWGMDAQKDIYGDILAMLAKQQVTGPIGDVATDNVQPY